MKLLSRNVLDSKRHDSFLFLRIILNGIFFPHLLQLWKRCIRRDKENTWDKEKIQRQTKVMMRINYTVISGTDSVQALKMKNSVRLNAWRWLQSWIFNILWLFVLKYLSCFIITVSFFFFFARACWFRIFNMFFCLLCFNDGQNKVS